MIMFSVASEGVGVKSNRCKITVEKVLQPHCAIVLFFEMIDMNQDNLGLLKVSFQELQIFILYNLAIILILFEKIAIIIFSPKVS